MRNVVLVFITLVLSYSLEAQVFRNETTNNSLIKGYQKAKKDYTMFENKHGHFVQTKNVKMHYLTWGNPKYPALIWSHGSFLNAYELLPVAEKIANSGFYIIAIDYYGHGSTAIPDHLVSLYHVADDIKLLMDNLKIKKAFIGGFSRGGYISTAFYDAYPASTLGLVLEDGGSVASNTYYAKLSTEELNKKAIPFDVKTHNPWDTTFINEFDAFRAVYDSSAKENQFPLLAIIKKNKEGRWGFYNGLLNLFNLENSKEFLDLTLRPTTTPLFAESMVIMEPKIIFRNLNVPVLILDPVSDNDPFPVEIENKTLQAEHQHFITYIACPNTEHNVLYDHPEKFTNDVVSFLKRH